MQIISARWIIDVVYPVLSIETDLGTADIFEIKPTLYDAGIVFLGADFEDKVPPITFPADPKDNRPALQLRGFTKDKTILALVREFKDALDKRTFAPRVIPIPEFRSDVYPANAWPGQ